MNKLSKPSTNFTTVPNGLLRDEAISMKAKGLCCIMFSKPDGWVFYEQSLVKESSDGRDAVRSALSELLARGWLVRTGGG